MKLYILDLDSYWAVHYHMCCEITYLTAFKRGWLRSSCLNSCSEIGREIRNRDCIFWEEKMFPILFFAMGVLALLSPTVSILIILEYWTVKAPRKAQKKNPKSFTCKYVNSTGVFRLPPLAWTLLYVNNVEYQFLLPFVDKRLFRIYQSVKNFWNNYGLSIMKRDFH